MNIFNFCFIFIIVVVVNKPTFISAWEVKLTQQLFDDSSHRYFSLAEIQFFKGNTQLNSSMLNCIMSSTDDFNGMFASHCLDGDLNNLCGTYPGDPSWISVVGPDDMTFDKIKIYNRDWQDLVSGCCAYRILNATVTYSVNSDVKFSTVLTTIDAVYEIQAGSTESAESAGSSSNQTISQKTPTSFRYLRWSGSGNTGNSGTHFSEIMILDKQGNNIVTSATSIYIISDDVAHPEHSIGLVKDGSTSNYFCTSKAGGVTIEVDLGNVSDVQSIKFWNLNGDRYYFNIQVMISKDRIAWQRAYGPTDTFQSESGTEIILATVNPTNFIIPTSYSYSGQPDTNYPDTGNVELTDGIISSIFWPFAKFAGDTVALGGDYFFGDPSNYYAAWTGFFSYSNPNITFEFPSAVAITNVSIFFQGDSVGNIALPMSIDISNKHFKTANSGTNGWQHFTGHWVGKSISIKLNNLKSYLFVSEFMFTEGKFIISAL